jgi:hypothetical protein
MATYTNLSDVNFAQKALDGFVATLLPLTTFSTNFEPSPVPYGNVVIVPLIGSLTATTFGGSYAVCGGTMTGVTVTINKHKHVPIGQNDITRANSSWANLERFAYQQGAGLAIAVLQDIFTLLTTANFVRATAVGNQSFGIAQILQARQDLNNNKVPVSGRSMVLDVAPYNSLLAITTPTSFPQFAMYGQQSGLVNASVPRALGFPEKNLPAQTSDDGKTGDTAPNADDILKQLNAITDPKEQTKWFKAHEKEIMAATNRIRKSQV